MSSTSPAKGVFETILDWSATRPLWQRDALRRIVQNGKLSVDDGVDLLTLCKQGHGASETIKADAFAATHIPNQDTSSAGVTLLGIAKVLGVNNLAPGQNLAFHPTGLTVVYGDNGSGKSGYVRILKHSCRARQRGTIEPNAYQTGPAPKATAQITFAVGGTAQAPQQWGSDTAPHPSLSLVSVFDRDCGAVHLTGQNAVAFRPFGLDIPDHLADTCKKMKVALQVEQTELSRQRNPLFAKPTWKATTQTGKALAGLSHETDFERVKAFSALTKEERTRLDQLKLDLARDPADAAAEHTAKANNLKQLITALTAIRTGVSDEVVDGTALAAINARTKREVAQLAATRAFSDESLPGIGGEVWKALWESARRFSATTTERPFPPNSEGEPCPLCLQPVTGDTVTRMTRFDQFIQLDTERVATAATTLASARRRALEGVRLSMTAVKAGMSEVKLRDAALAKRIRRFVASARLRRYRALQTFAKGEKLQMVALVDDPIASVESMELASRTSAKEMQATATAEGRKQALQQLDELSDRTLLASILPEIKAEIERLQAVKFFDACMGDTNTHQITRLGNELADAVLTPKLRDRFQREIVKLAADKVRVEIVRSGGEVGTPQYQVRLFASPRSKVANILSEGEQTCVALAAFLTELATATNQSALVFDDPVTSLDHRWREQVGNRLVEEAAIRQIVVFTHDLIFANDLVDLAETNKLPIECFNLSRGAQGAGAVAAGMPWKGKGVLDRLDKLDKDARAAKTLYEINDEASYSAEIRRIYSELRATWERGIEDIAFAKVLLRHRDYVNVKFLRKASVLNDEDCDLFAKGHKSCCDVIDGHDPSRGRNAAPPAPQKLLDDIQEVVTWVNGIRDRQKTLA